MIVELKLNLKANNLNLKLLLIASFLEGELAT